MKSKLLSTLIVLLSLFGIGDNHVKANHAAGGELIYIHLSDSTYQFIFKFYRDCRGPAAPTEFDLCAFNTCTNQSFMVDLKQWQGPLPPDNRQQGSPVSPGCSNAKTQCDSPGSVIPGYEEWWYQSLPTTLPLKCNYWRFSALVGTTALCCRNFSTNLQGTPNFYIETTFNTSINHRTGIMYKDPITKVIRQRGPWDNSSPYYSVKPIPYVCINDQYTYNNGAIDTDGDSLSSQMVNPMSSTSCSSTPTLAPLQNMNPPVNFTTNPFQTNNSFSLNPATGQMNFTAALLGGGTLSIRTREFTRDQNNAIREIGSIMRDVQVQVIACSTNAPAITNIYMTDTNGAVQNGQIYGCMGTPLKFCFTVAISDTAGRLIIEDNLLTAIPGAKITYTNSGTDTVTGCFEWTPTAGDIGSKRFIVIIKDSTCRPPGILFQYVHNVELYIWGPIQASADTSICNGEPAFLGVTGGGNYEWSVLSGSDPSLSNPFTSNPVATPTLTTVYQVTSRANNYCPSLNKDTVTIAVLKGPDIAGQPDILTCPNFEVGMDLGLVKVPNATYNIKWTPTTGLSNATIDNPKVKLKTTQTYIAEIGSDINRCKTFDTVLVDVLTGVAIENPDTQICIGQKVDVRGTGDARYDYKWDAPTDQSASFSNAGGIITSITPSDTGRHKFILHATHINCPGIDSTVNFDIDVQPIPSVQVNEDESLCYGDTMQLTAIVTPNTYPNYTYSWTPGATLDFPDRKNPIFSGVNEGETKITFIAKTPAGCSDTDDVVLNVYAAEFIYMPNDTAICAGDSIVLRMTTEPGVKLYWQPDYNISSITSLQPLVWPVANQEFAVYGVDSFGCLDTGIVNIAVRPRAILELPDTVIIYPGESYKMDPGGNCLYYTWFPPLGLSNADISNPAVSPKVNTRYIVHGSTEAGCTAIDSIDILVNSDVILTVPNAFSPGNPRNGILKVIRRGDVTLKRFAVYNRWGTKVFETSDINEGWDGTYNGEKQPMGVFVYTVEAVSGSGQSINKQGNVTLLR